MVSISLEILQIILLLIVITFLLKKPKEKSRHIPHVPGIEKRGIITPSGNVIVREKLKPKAVTDDAIVERESGY